MNAYRLLRERFADHPSRQYKVGRNPSYLRSVRNGLISGLWWIPASLSLVFRYIAIPLVIQIANAIWVIGLMLVFHFLRLLCGLAGQLQDAEVKVPSEKA
jgi:hypothetical protein